MSEKKAKGPKRYWPAWRYHETCPEGQIFQNAEDVPPGWVAHPSKIGGAEPAPQGAGSPQTTPAPSGRKTKAEKEEEKRLALLAQARAKFGDIVPATASIAELESALNPAASNGNGS